MSKSKSLQNTKMVLRSLVNSNPGGQGITIEQLNRDYHIQENEPIPFRALGFIRTNNSTRVKTVFAIQTKDSEHITKLVQEQRPAKKSTRNNRCRHQNRQPSQRLYQAPRKNSSNGGDNYRPFPRPSTVQNNRRPIEVRFSATEGSDWTTSMVEKRLSEKGLSSPQPAPTTEPKNKCENALSSVKYSEVVNHHSNIKPAEYYSDSKSTDGSDNVCDEGNSGAVPRLVPLQKNVAADDLSATQSTPKSVSTPKTISSSDISYAVSQLDIGEDKTNSKLNSDDDALPELKDDDPVFLFDVPKNVANITVKIKESVLPPTLNVDSLIRLFVTEINSPFKFWFHLQQDKHPLDQLMSNMECFYTTCAVNQLNIAANKARRGQVCAALFMRLWHRAEIVQPLSKDDTVKVHFVDYGTTASVPLTGIKYLLDEFCTLPSQVFRGCLDFIQPVGHRWTRESCYAFLSLVSDLQLYGKVTRIDEDNRIVYMLMIDTNGMSQDVQINDLLVRQRHARVKPMETMNKLHYSERHPTFDMLEMGLYPSFADIGALLARDIDFEAIQDENVSLELDILSNERISAAIVSENDYTLDTTDLLNRTVQLLSSKEETQSDVKEDAPHAEHRRNENKENSTSDLLSIPIEQLSLQPLPDSCGSLESLESLPPPNYAAPILAAAEEQSSPSQVMCVPIQRIKTPPPKGLKAPRPLQQISQKAVTTAEKQIVRKKNVHQKWAQSRVNVQHGQNHYQLGSHLYQQAHFNGNFFNGSHTFMGPASYVPDRMQYSFMNYPNFVPQHFVDPFAQRMYYHQPPPLPLLQHSSFQNLNHIGSNKFSDEFRNLMMVAMQPKYHFKNNNWKNY